MAHRAGLGVDLDVAMVPRREEGMTPLEVMLSESQERMVLTAHPGREVELLELLHHWELDAVPVGVVRDHGRFRIFEGGELVGDMPVLALNEAPTYVRQGIERPSTRAAREASLDDVPIPSDAGAVLLKLLASPTIASKRAVFQRYDHQVMTNTVVLPGAADAAVMRIKGSRRGVAATVDCNARFVGLAPRRGAALAVVEAARNLVCVGATPLGVTDNLNFGNPTDPEVYFELSEAIDGLAEACLALNTPVTGGNVSLYNQYRAEGGAVRAILPTPTVGMVGFLPDVARRATLALSRAGDVLVLLGGLSPHIGASHYLAEVHGREEGEPPALELAAVAKLLALVAGEVQSGVIDVAHDIGDGGLAVAVAEMAIAGAVGATLDLAASDFAATVRPDAALFGEVADGVLVSLPAVQLDGLLRRAAAAGVPARQVGSVGGLELIIDLEGWGLRIPLDELEAAYEGTIAEALA
jgi:phosphoribosylformylglycinamidine synthase